MIRRILVLATVIGSIGIGLVAGGRLALSELGERAWERRKQELSALAHFPPKERRPWEIRFSALQTVALSSPRFAELAGSSHRAPVVWGSVEPRPFDDLERLWVESLWSELAGLDSILTELRTLPLDELEWPGDPPRISVLRELVNALCARAWLAVEHGDAEAAVLSYGDALRLARATDDSTQIGTVICMSCEGIVLRSLRSALDLGLSPAAARAGVAPLLEDWAYDAERAAHTIRRELASVGRFPDAAPDLQETHDLLAWAKPVEAALALAREPVTSTPWARRDAAKNVKRTQVDHDWEMWVVGIEQLHARHALRNVALSALAVASFRERHGTWPETLAAIEDLSAPHALDTLTGAPLPYSAAENGARIGPASWGKDDIPDADGSLFVWNLSPSSAPAPRTSDASD